VWQEFWITGDCNGRGLEPSDPDWPLDHGLFLTCAYDTVKLLRNHASLALWCGGNEQHPAEDINEALKKNLKIASDNENPSIYLDGTRLYIQGRFLYKGAFVINLHTSLWIGGDIVFLPIATDLLLTRHLVISSSAI